MIRTTETARQRIAKLNEQSEQPVKGLRVIATARSPIRASFAMRFVVEGEVECPTDVIQSFDEIDIYVDSGTAAYLEGATIDYVFALMASGFRVEAPPRKLDTPDGALVERIQKILDEEVNPSLSEHGGGATSVDVKGGSVYLELTGGCQGCSMAGSTMRDGIEVALKEQIPEIEEVLDVTEHAEGRNPFFRR